jgi:HEAT repeat protein
MGLFRKEKLKGPDIQEMRGQDPPPPSAPGREQPASAKFESTAPEKTQNAVDLAEYYMGREHPADATLSMLGVQSTKPVYKVVKGQVGRESQPHIDMKIASVASCLPGDDVDASDSTAIARLAFNAIEHYASLPKVQALFLLPYRIRAGTVTQGSAVPPEETCRVYSGVENLLLEIYGELSAGAVVTDKVVEQKIEALIQACVTASDVSAKVGDRDGQGRQAELRAATSWEVRRDAAEALGKAGNREAVPDLVNALRNDSHWVVRFTSALALGEIGDVAALEPLTEALRDQNDSVREYTLKALGSLGDSGFDVLVQALRDHGLEERKEIPHILQERFPDRAFEPLAEALRDDPSGDVRAWACRSLGLLGDKRALPLLVQALQVPRTRVAAIAALRDLKDQDAIEPLVKLLQTGTPDEYQQVSETLVELGWQPTTEAESLAMLLGQQSYEEAIERFGESAIPPLLDLLDDPRLSFKASDALAKVGHAGVGPIVAQLAQTRSLKSRLLLLRALNQIDDPAAAQAVASFVARWKTAMQTYGRARAEQWWMSNEPEDPRCDRCCSPLTREDSHLVTSWMRCGACTTEALDGWDFSYDWFGAGTMEKALGDR